MATPAQLQPCSGAGPACFPIVPPHRGQGGSSWLFFTFRMCPYWSHLYAESSLPILIRISTLSFLSPKNPCFLPCSVTGKSLWFLEVVVRLVLAVLRSRHAGFSRRSQRPKNSGNRVLVNVFRGISSLFLKADRDRAESCYCNYLMLKGVSRVSSDR